MINNWQLQDLLQIKWHTVNYFGLGTLTLVCNARTLLSGSGIERWVLAKSDQLLPSITDNCKLGKFCYHSTCVL